MKRIFILFLIGVLVLSVGCSKDVLKEPPGLKVTDGVSEVIAKRGTYSWSYADGMSWSGVDACGVHPVEMEPNVLSTSEDTVMLEFSTNPDSLAVTVWHDEEEYETGQVSGNVLTLLDGYHIYEVTADWGTETYHGDASYVFAVEKPVELTLDDIKEIPVLTVSTGDAQVNALRGTCSWEYSNGTARSSVTREGMHPAEIGLDLPTIVTSEQEVLLGFSLEPDSLTVKYWMDEYVWESEPEEISVSDYVLSLKVGGGYYEVTATWDSDDRYSGVVTYAFYRIDPEFLTYPIRMTVHYGDETYKPGVGAETWGFDDDHDGEWYGYIAELIHPLDTTFRTERDFETTEAYVTLEFPVEPDEISAHCWSEDCLGNFFAPYEECVLEDYQLVLKPGNYIYEVTATWKQDDCGGTIYYSFYVTNG